MKIGILADIHEDVEALDRAIALLRREGIDRLVVLGDLFYEGKRVTETTDLLAAAGAVGVWGNHDMGLCHEPEPKLLARYPGRVFEFTRTLEQRLEVDDCLFSHGLPHWDATDPAAYYLGDPPESDAGRAASFTSSACRVTFVGHFHRWLCATPAGLVPWCGNKAAFLNPAQRFLVAVAAVCDGRCAVYDTADASLVPHQLADGRSEGVRVGV